MRKVRALTLVELLVAIAIVGVLVALAFVAGRAALSAVKSNQCLQNLSQIGKGLELYAQDHDGYFPPYFQQDGVTTAGIRKGHPELLKKALMAYGLNDSQFYCPADESARQKTNVRPKTKNMSSEHMSYVWPVVEGWVYERDKAVGSTLSFLRFSASEVSRPAEFVTFMDMASGVDPETNHSFHGPFFNCLFLDGHVKSVRNTDLKSYRYGS